MEGEALGGQPSPLPRLVRSVACSTMRRWHAGTGGQSGSSGPLLSMGAAGTAVQFS
jgi:hypothetical protein